MSSSNVKQNTHLSIKSISNHASPTGVSAILSHSVEGQERPVSYASRSLSNAEMNYSQLDHNL